MKALTTLMLLVCGPALAGQAPPAEAGPHTDGKQLMLAACVQCHDLRWIVGQRKSEAEWRHTVNVMIWRGAPLMPGEAGVIAGYLAAMQPKRAEQKKPVDDEAAKALPPGSGRRLVMASCVQCHDLATTTSQRKTAEEWRRSVEQMAHLGARLNGSEIDLVAKYLAGAFGTSRSGTR